MTVQAWGLIMLTVVNLLTLLRDALRDPGKNFDLCGASMLSALGLWVLQPGMLAAKYPRIASDLAARAPIWVWGSILAGVGISLLVSVVLSRHSLIITMYALSFCIWIAIGWLFCVRTFAPPPEGVMAPVMAVFIANRVINQIPT